MLPKIYTPQEVAQILRLSTDEVIQAVETEQIEGFEVVGEWRIPESSLQKLIAGGQVIAKHGHTAVSLKPSKPFDYTWPNGMERYWEAYEGEASLDGHTFHVKVGLCTRVSHGRERGRVLVFLDGYPVTEFVETDVPNYYTSLLPGADNPRANLRVGERVPTHFSYFDVRPMRDLVEGSGVYNAQVAVIKSSDFEAMVKFALLKARHKGRI